jgi:hypothetical protein
MRKILAETLWYLFTPQSAFMVALTFVLMLSIIYN